MQLLRALDGKLTEQINENKQLKDELVLIRHELEEFKTIVQQDLIKHT